MAGKNLFAACWALFLAAGVPLCAQTSPNYGKVPLYFEENQGQTDSHVRFVARGGNILGFVTKTDLTLSMGAESVKIRVAGARSNPSVLAGKVVEGVSNYYLGSLALPGVKHYASVLVSGVRPGLDIEYHANGTNLEYDLVVHPGFKPSDLRLKFEGSANPSLDESGDIVLKTRSGEMRQHKPKVWQNISGIRREIACQYILERSGDVRLELAKYDPDEKLVVDPVISYSTYLAGTSWDAATGIAVDGQGNAYLTGFTQSSDFPTRGGLGGFHGVTDAFVTVLNPTGSALIYSTFLGGNLDDESNSIAVDGSANVYITGFTYSANFPLTTGQGANGQHAFVAKLSSTGAIMYSVLFAGDGNDSATALAVDNAGAAYITGSTTSTTQLATLGAFRTMNAGGTDAFVAKFSSAGAVIYATYLGGSYPDAGTAIRVDSSGYVFVAGSTASADFPTTIGAYAVAPAGSQDAFVAKLNSTGTNLIFSTFLGGSQEDTATALEVDSSGNTYVAGNTQSFNFPTTPSAFNSSKPNTHTFTPAGFVTSLNPTGTMLRYSTYLGGDTDESVSSIALTANGSALIAGYTESPNFPVTPGAIHVHQPSQYCCDRDAFLVRLTPDGTALSYATLLGSVNFWESAAGIAIDLAGDLYVTGTTSGLTYPTSAAGYQRTSPKQNGINSVFVTKIDLNSLSLCNPVLSPSSVSLPGKGGNFSFDLSLSSGCPWEASNDDSVVLTSFSHGIKTSSLVTITGFLGQNQDTSNGHTGSVWIGASTFAINQAPGSCADPGFNPLALNFDTSGGIQTLFLTLPQSCSWTAVSNAPWLTITTAASGTGQAQMTISAGQNSFSPRAATLTIAGKTVAVTQSGSNCTATISAIPQAFSAAGGTGVLRISTSSPMCGWTASTGSSWLQLASSSSGQGTGAIPFQVASNPGSVSRSTQILLADQTVTISQSAGPAGVVASYTLSTIAGGGAQTGPPYGDGGPATAAYLYNILGLAFDASSNSVLISDQPHGRIRIVTPDGLINTFAGGGTDPGENVPALSALITQPAYMAADNSGRVYFADAGARVRTVFQQNVSTFAGTTYGFDGDGGPATAARLGGPTGMVADGNNFFIADTGNQRIRRVSNGMISTFAGGGTNGLGDGGPATQAQVSGPLGLAVDGAGSLYIADLSNNRIRRVSNGVMTTVAGGGSGGDGVAATSASLSGPRGVAFDPLGNMFISESGRIRQVTPDGTIHTVAGNGLLGTVSPSGITTDPYGGAYFWEYDAVRKLTPVASFCTYSVPTPAAQPTAGGSLSISVATSTGCLWSSSSDVPWLAIGSNSSGSGPGMVQITVSANASSGTRTGTVAIAGKLIQITQLGTAPALILSRSVLNFGDGTSEQIVNVNFSCCAKNIVWSAVADFPIMVHITNGGGVGNGSFFVRGDLGPGATITVTANGVANSPQRIQANVDILPETPPVGSFDTPLNNTTGIAGAVAVTGWALDLSEVAKVDIWREPVGNETGASNGLIYIGDAVFVADARPDVEAANPTAPLNYRAGWGYLLLTNFLPGTNGGAIGNGTYKLHAIAHNRANLSTDLGTRTITTDNAHAAKPFGTIDAPGQGATISGAGYYNFGWALTQNPNCIPVDGSTITVNIDGVNLPGHPVYNQNRSDIATTFPGRCNSGGAVGFFPIDTTQFSNGVHTMGWVVYDNQGHGDGIGSRYFNIQNTGTGSAAPDETPIALSSAGRRLASLKRDPKRGYTISAGQLDRLEIETGGVSGYLQTDSGRLALPGGSTLRSGIFYWQLAPGFLGDYPLVFVQPDGSEVRLRVSVAPSSPN